jgi:hypothetical protein
MHLYCWSTPASEWKARESGRTFPQHRQNQFCRHPAKNTPSQIAAESQQYNALFHPYKSYHAIHNE